MDLVDDAVAATVDVARLAEIQLEFAELERRQRQAFERRADEVRVIRLGRVQALAQRREHVPADRVAHDRSAWSDSEPASSAASTASPTASTISTASAGATQSGSHSNTAMLSTCAVCGNMLTAPAATQR